MKKYTLVLLCTLMVHLSFAQVYNNGESLYWAENTETMEECDYQPSSMKQITPYDFSKIVLDDHYFIIGIIGDEFQRLDIKLISVIKNHAKPEQYFVYGKSKVKNNICEFQGTISLIKHYKQHKNVHANYLEEGYVLANCDFYENVHQRHTGYFKGVLKIFYGINKNKELEYPDDGDVPNSNYNNGFVGTWTHYKTKHARLAHWGSDFVPLSKDLNIAAAIGDFIPNNKYANYGWLYTQDGWVFPTPKDWWK